MNWLFQSSSTQPPASSTLVEKEKLDKLDKPDILDSSNMTDVAKQKLQEILQGYQSIQNIKTKYDLHQKNSCLNSKAAKEKNQIDFNNFVLYVKKLKTLDLDDSKGPKDPNVTDTKDPRDHKDIKDATISTTADPAVSTSQPLVDYKQGDLLEDLFERLVKYIGTNDTTKCHLVVGLTRSKVQTISTQVTDTAYWVSTCELKRPSNKLLDSLDFFNVASSNFQFQLEVEKFKFQQQYLKMATEVLSYGFLCLEPGHSVYHTFNDHTVACEYKIQALKRTYAKTSYVWMKTNMNKFDIIPDMKGEIYMGFCVVDDDGKAQRWILFPQFSELFKHTFNVDGVILDDKNITQILSLVTNCKELLIL